MVVGPYRTIGSESWDGGPVVADTGQVLRSDSPMTHLPRALLRPLAMLAGALLVASLAIPAAATPASAASIATVADAEAALIRLLNSDREKAGLVPLRVDATLMRIAGDRSADMVRYGYFSHTEPDGDTYLDYVRAAGLTWYAGGETIASDRYPGLDYSVGVTRLGWMNSPSHKAIVLSKDYNYFGVGLAVSSVGIHRWTAVYLKMPDHSGGSVEPGLPSLTAASAGKRTMTLSYRAADLRLQVLTAGLRDVEVQRRIDGGGWGSLGWTTATSTRQSLAVGHAYEFRFRARDLRGNVGSWSRVVTVRP